MRPVLCPVVVGRDQELELLEGELERARDGSGGVTFLLGEAGIGKSRLARETETKASALGMGVLRGRAVQSAAPVPFRPLAEAFNAGLRDRTVDDPSLVPFRPALGQLIPDWAGAPAGREASPLVLLEAVVRLLRALAGQAGLLLVLEDLHWADGDTLAVVEYLADNLAAEPVLCVATIRSDELSAAATLAEALAARRAAAAVRLRRLAEADVAEMVDACMQDARLSGEALEILRRRAEGVPFLVEELLSAALADGGGAPDERVAQALPASYRDLVRSRLDRVGPETRRVVEAASVLGRSFDWTLLPDVTGRGEEDVLAGLRSAVDAQLLSVADEGFEFRHALLRESILAELLPPERRHLSLRVADVIEETRPGLPGELCELAADLRERGGDLDGAFRLLLEAARRALARTALSTGEATAERARRVGAADPWLGMGADMLLAEILSLAGKVDRLREVGARALEAVGARLSMGTPDRIAGIHLRIARGIADAGDLAMAEPNFERATALASEERLVAAVRALGARLALHRGDLAEASAEAGEALAAAQRLSIPEAASDALVVQGRVALSRGLFDEAVQAIDRARVVGDRADLTLVRVRALVERAALDELTTAELDRARQAAELAARTGAVFAAARADLQLARLHLLRFELDETGPALSRCIEACRRFSLRLLPEALTVGAVLAARAGRKEKEAAPQTEDPILLAALAEARAATSLVAERRAAARRELDRAMAIVPRGGPPLAWTFPGLWAVVASVDRVGEDPAPEITAVGGMAHRANAALLAFSRAMFLGREGSEDATAAFDEADRAAAPFPWHRRIARRLVAEAAVADGWGQPGRWLREDLAFFEAAGFERIAAACRGLLRRAGERVPRRGRGESVVPPELRAAGVTSREVDVLRLIGEGLSNTEIAGRLFLSPRTVQTHAISLLRKLGLESRAQLVAFAARMASSADR